MTEVVCCSIFPNTGLPARFAPQGNFLTGQKVTKDPPKAGPSPALWNPPRGTGCTCVRLVSALVRVGSHRWLAVLQFVLTPLVVHASIARAYPGGSGVPAAGSLASDDCRRECLPHFLCCCGRGRGLPGPLVSWHCPGGFGRGKPLPYAHQPKKFGDVQGLFASSPPELRCQAPDRWEQRLTRVRPWESKHHPTEEWAPPTECLRHLCDLNRPGPERGRRTFQPVPQGGP